MDKILIIEDEKIIRELLADNFEFEGFYPCQAEDLKTGSQLLSKEDFSLIMLDINLPDGNGIDWLKNIRENGNLTPVIVCTVRDREIDVIKALEAGADDYVNKPFRIRELIARVKAVIRRNKKPIISKHKVGILTIDFSSRTAQNEQQKEVRLTTTEWQLLEYFLPNKNQVLSREQIIEQIWGISDLEDSRAVDVHIGRLRKKLEPTEKPTVLLTVRGFGYKLEL